MTTSLSGVRRALLACLQDVAAPLDRALVRGWTDDTWRGLLDAAAAGRVRPLVQQALRRPGNAGLAPAFIVGALREACQAIAAHALHLHAELASVAAAFTDARISAIVLKGCHLGPAVYGNVGLREMTDVDVMVPRPHLAAAASIIERLGYRPEAPYAIDAVTAASHHLPDFIKPPAAIVELHWNLATPGRAYSIDPDELWARARPVPPALVLCPEDLLLHLCGHAAYQHDFQAGLRPYCDLAATIRHYGGTIDWDAVRGRADAWNWTRGVGLALALASDLVGATVPAEVRAAITPDADVLASARALALGGITDRSIPVDLLRLAADEPLPAKMRRVARRVFRPAGELRTAYGDPSGLRAMAPLLYARRFRDLLARHGFAAGRFLRRPDPETAALPDHRERVRRWLALA